MIPKVWYWAVKARGRWCDSDLNIEFIRYLDGTKYIKEEQVHVFEDIRKMGVMPSSGKHRLRDFDLVERVDADPNFSGTARVMNSPFWRLLKAMPGDLQEAIKLADECLCYLGLKRVHGDEALLWLASCDRWQPQAERHGLHKDFVSDFEYLLQRATKHLPIDLDSLTLFGAMYREACLSFRPENAEVLGHYFDISLMEFCSQSWISAVAPELEDIARHRVLYGEKDYLPAEIGSDIYEQAVCIAGGVVVNVAEEIRQGLIAFEPIDL